MEKRHPADIYMFDLGTPGQIAKVRQARCKGSRVLIYPHAARPVVAWDGFVPLPREVDTIFVSAKGHVDVLRAYGVDKRIVVSGWSYCDIQPFRKSEKIETVLFAPIHPNNNGFIPPAYKDANQRAFAILQNLAKVHGFSLRVRHLNTLENNGLCRVDGVEYIQGLPNLNFSDAKDADVVVAAQTYAFACVAMGIPTVMFGENIPPQTGTGINDLKSARSWERYKELMKFPIDLLDFPKGREYYALEWACDVEKDSEILEWKSRMIGKPFDPQVLYSVIFNLKGIAR
jgi:hypothetical protein